MQRKEMKRNYFTLSLIIVLALSSISAFANGHSSRSNNNYNKKRTHGKSSRYRIKRIKRSSSKSHARKITNTPIVFSGVLESKDGKLLISGNKMPLEVDRGMTSLASKHVGKEVQITGTRVTVDGKSKVKVKFIKPSTYK